MNPNEQYALNWNHHTTHMKKAFDTLLTENEFVDVTISCEGRRLEAHKLLLSACSPYFHSLLRDNPCQHPIIVLQDIKFQNLVDILKFIYVGEVSVSQDNLQSFLKTAELFQVSGLTDEDNNAMSESARENTDEITKILKNDVTSGSSKSSVKSFGDRSEFKKRTRENKKDDESVRKKRSSNEVIGNFRDDINIKQEIDSVVENGEYIESEANETQFIEAPNYNEQDLTNVQVNQNVENTCPVCFKTFSHRVSLRQHRPVHSGETTCFICKKSFSRTYYLKKHIMCRHRFDPRVSNLQKKRLSRK